MDDLKCCCSVSVVTSDADRDSLFSGWALSQIQLLTGLVKEDTGRAHLIQLLWGLLASQIRHQDSVGVCVNGCALTC